MTLRGLMEHPANPPAPPASAPGQKLPDTAVSRALLGIPVSMLATFGGSPRCMRRPYLDAMSIVVRFGPPGLISSR
eukprot:8469670-Pyramimonas_sp.AAC.1